MKKPIAVFMCLVLLITTCIAAVSAIGTDEPTITCESITCKPGDQVEVSVTVSNNPGFMYLELTPVYSSELTLATVKNGELISDLTKGKQYVWVADEDVAIDGTLVTLTFDVADTVPDGEYDVGFILRGCYNYDEESVAFTVVNGTVTVKSDPADYSEYNAVVEAAKTIDRSAYTAESLAALDKALADNSVEQNLPVSNQSVIDTATENIQNAINALVPKANNTSVVSVTAAPNNYGYSYHHYDVKVKGQAEKIQIVYASGATITFSRRDSMTTDETSTGILEIKAYDENGQFLAVGSEADIAYEIWTINVRLAEGSYDMRAKTTTWEEDSYSFEIAYDVRPDIKTITVTPESTTINKGDEVTFTVVATKDVRKVKFSYGMLSTITRELKNGVDNGDGTYTYQISFKLSSIKTYDLEVTYLLNGERSYQEYGYVSVTVTQPASTETKITVTPATTTVNKGDQLTFTVVASKDVRKVRFSYGLLSTITKELKDGVDNGNGTYTYEVSFKVNASHTYEIKYLLNGEKSYRVYGKVDITVAE